MTIEQRKTKKEKHEKKKELCYKEKKNRQKINNMERKTEAKGTYERL